MCKSLCVWFGGGTRSVSLSRCGMSVCLCLYTSLGKTPWKKKKKRVISNLSPTLLLRFLLKTFPRMAAWILKFLLPLLVRESAENAAPRPRRAPSRRIATPLFTPRSDRDTLRKGRPRKKETSIQTLLPFLLSPSPQTFLLLLPRDVFLHPTASPLPLSPLLFSP